jgi:pimeloyl-ACP methyl ester carboxylesterase
MPTLHHALVTAKDASPSRWMLFLHGILGTGGNWRSVARQWVEQRPGWGAVLVDLRMHGQSQGFVAPHTLAACAEDLIALEGALPGPVDGILGHSFGGKVALEYLLRKGGNLELAYVLDSCPGPRPDYRGSEMTMGTLALLERMPPVLDRREDFVAWLEKEGVLRDMAQWLAMNVKRTPEGKFVYGVDLRAIHALLDDYFVRDLWRPIEAPPGRARIEMVIGGESPVVDAGDRQRAARAAERHPHRVRVTVVPGAGHWVHVDAPGAVLEALVAVT